MSFISEFIHAPWSLAFLFVLMLCLWFVLLWDKRAKQVEFLLEENKYLRKVIKRIDKK